MRLIEADGKALLAEAGIAVPAGRLYHPGEEIAAASGRVAIKAQMLAGGRGKQGLVRVVDGAAAAAAAGEIRALAGPAVPLLVEAAVDIAAEFYMAWRIDDVAQAPVLMFSPAGGIAVEERPDALREYRADPRRPVRPHDLVGFFRAAGAAGRNLGALARFAAELGRVFRAIDAELIEINPLALTSAGGLVALDAKVVVDDNAAFRHRSRRGLVSHALEQAGMTALERRAAGVGEIDALGEVQGWDEIRRQLISPRRQGLGREPGGVDHQLRQQGLVHALAMHSPPAALRRQPLHLGVADQLSAVSLRLGEQGEHVGVGIDDAGVRRQQRLGADHLRLQGLRPHRRQPT